MNDLVLGIYLAGSFETIGLQQIFSAWLSKSFGNNIAILSTWHQEGSVESVVDRANIDFLDISASHVVVASYPHGYGTASEVGYAIGQERNVLWHKHPDIDDESMLPEGLLVEWSDIKDTKPQLPIWAFVRTPEEIEEALSTILTLERDKYNERLYQG